MKKAAKGIIGLAAVLAVLGGGLAVLKLTEPNESAESSAEVSEVYGKGIAILKEGVVENAILRNDTGEYKFLLIDGSEGDYTLDGYQDIPLEMTDLRIIPSSAATLKSNAIADDDCSDLAKFGLDKPSAEVEFNYRTGDSIKLYIGNQVPTGSDFYVMTSEKNTVYTIGSYDQARYDKKLEDFISKTVLETPADDEYPIVNSLRIERTDMDTDIYLEYNEKNTDAYASGSTATHRMVEPVDAYLAVESSAAISNGLFGLVAEGYYSLHPTEADIAEADLADPFCKVTMKCDNGKDYVFLMSEPYTDENGTKLHYAMFEGGNIIYIVSAENAKWGTVKPIDITSKLVVGSYVWALSELKVTGKDVEESVFKITPDDPDSKMIDRDKDNMKVTRNGAEIDSERYRQFYALLIKAEGQELALDEPVPTGEPILTIEYTDAYMNEHKKVDFYQNSALGTLIVVDGKSKWFGSRSYAETMAENANKIGSSDDFVDTWK